MSLTARRGAWTDFILGAPGRPRHRVLQTLLALATYCAFALLQQAEVRMGLIQRGPSDWLSGVNLTVASGFFLLVRSGLSARISGDPSLTLAQSVYALGSVCCAYALAGPTRGVVIPIMILVILFGMFKLTPRQCLAIACTGFLMLGSVMAWRANNQPQVYNPLVELIYFLTAAIIISASALLTIRLGRLRARLTEQKTELERALEMNRQLATRDSLTGLPNRRAMVTLLVREQRRERRANGPMALAILDIDWFKQINDTFGHRVGDAVLQRFAELARMELRTDDVLARWGGEEFLLMMPGTRRESAHAALDRMRVRIVEGGFEGLADGLTVSFSAGITECIDEEPYASAIERADQALYQAKNSGRNRIQCG
jgi:diguanylate cyclase